MENEFVTYEQALALKELGFNEECFKYIYIGDTGNGYDHYIEVEPSKAKKYNEDDLCISQPLKQQAFRWFRKKYNVDYYISKQLPNIGSKFSDGRFAYSVVINDMYYPLLTRDTYEEAENACLDKLIELIKEQ